MAKDLAIVLSNGSVNSAVAGALAAQRYRLVMVNAVTSGAAAGQGGGTVGGRRAAYDLQVGHFKPYREHTVPMPWVGIMAKASAAAGGAVDPRAGGAVGPMLMELVPLVGVAARFAAHYQAAAIYLGLRVGPGVDELAQATEWVAIWNEMMQMPCGQTELEVHAPLLELEAWQVVELGMQIGAPLEKTWSCTEGSGNEPCGACRGCRAREAAFVQAAKADPMKVVKK